ncbi:MAG TPA: hypothetical protein VF772_19830, partial [Terriglobales bacterium]
MIIGEPIPTTGMLPRQMDELAARVRTVMHDTYYAQVPKRQRVANTVSSVIPSETTPPSRGSVVEGPLSSASIFGEQPESR